MLSRRITTAIITSRVHGLVLCVGFLGLFLDLVRVVLRVQVRIACGHFPLCNAYFRTIRGPLRDYYGICVRGA